VPAVAVPVRAPDPDSLARVTLNYQRLARIFSAMRPDEAAPVLAQLEDSQLEGILMAMQGRNAAPILAEMDPDRAAALSRRVLRAPQ
jgi:flagellar motility protein MotE (MotC chaperone)